MQDIKFVPSTLKADLVEKRKRTEELFKGNNAALDLLARMLEPNKDERFTIAQYAYTLYAVN